MGHPQVQTLAERGELAETLHVQLGQVTNCVD